MKSVTAYDSVNKINPLTCLEIPPPTQPWDGSCWRLSDPDRTIRIWRWTALQYQALTAAGAPSQARRNDYIELCLHWANTKDQRLVLDAAPLEELTRAEAASLLEEFRMVPPEFFGREFARLFPGIWAWDYSAMQSPKEFEQKIQPAQIIFAVDWNTGAYNFAYGFDALENCPIDDRATTASTVTFAVEFDTEELDRFIAGVKAVKGWAEWNGERH